MEVGWVNTECSSAGARLIARELQSISQPKKLRCLAVFARNVQHVVKCEEQESSRGFWSCLSLWKWVILFTEQVWPAADIFCVFLQKDPSFWHSFSVPRSLKIVSGMQFMLKFFVR